jgi:ribonuclease Z
MHTEFFSKGLYSTWMYLKSLNMAFDAGEGMATHLGNRTFGIRRIFISHGHIDHISGLAALIGIRGAARGDKEAPMEILYPKGNESIQSLRRYIESGHKHRPLTYELSWREIEPEEDIKHGDTWPVTIRPFRVKHTHDSLGFSISETRKRLAPPFRGQSPEVIALARKNGEKTEESYDKILWAYTGDAHGVKAKDVQGADWLLADTTFLDPLDRGDLTHASLDENLELAKEAGIKNLVGIHISPRYGPAALSQAQRNAEASLKDTKTSVALCSARTFEIGEGARPGRSPQEQNRSHRGHRRDPGNRENGGRPRPKTGHGQATLERNP